MIESGEDFLEGELQISVEKEKMQTGKEDRAKNWGIPGSVSGEV